ncbi:hypothetical protein NKH52_15800 [Mesorhizobium sp. M1066]|uniref:hypothetical protein n=1 Tax=unclassified Mesorhizobium TaxID=325217 RepID=UPI00333C1C95
MNEPLLPPIAMLAELTHRFPLQCPYALMPSRASVERQVEIVEAAYERLRGIMNI